MRTIVVPHATTPRIAEWMMSRVGGDLAEGGRPHGKHDKDGDEGSQLRHAPAFASKALRLLLITAVISPFLPFPPPAACFAPHAVCSRRLHARLSRPPMATRRMSSSVASLPRELARDGPPVEDDHPVAHLQGFQVVRGEHHHRDPLRQQLLEDPYTSALPLCRFPAWAR